MSPASHLLFNTSMETKKVDVNLHQQVEGALGMAPKKQMVDELRKIENERRRRVEMERIQHEEKERGERQRQRVIMEDKRPGSLSIDQNAPM